jgi:hypothetical protein
MVVAVDGKPVGGMTTVAVEMVLEQAGPQVVVIVSRQKFDEPRKNRINSENEDVNCDCGISNGRRVEIGDERVNLPRSPSISAARREQHVDQGLASERTAYRDTIAVRRGVPDSSVGMTSPQNGQSIQLANQECHDQKERGEAMVRSSWLPGAASFPTVLRTQQTRPHRSFVALGDGHLCDDDIDRSNKSVVPTGMLDEHVENASLVCGYSNRKSNPVNQPLQEENKSESAEEEHDDSSIEEGSDDLGVCNGCICGETHKRSRQHHEIFWLRCDRCGCWYDCSSNCVGFSESMAEAQGEWNCWACDDHNVHDHDGVNANCVTKSGSSVFLSVEGLDKPDMSSLCNRIDYGMVATVESQVASGRGGRVSTSPTASEMEKLSGPSRLRANVQPEQGTIQHARRFAQGDLVFVKEHSWSGVNNPEGVAKVVATYLDEDADRVYDIKYIVGGTSKGVLNDYLSLHHFE